MKEVITNLDELEAKVKESENCILLVTSELNAQLTEIFTYPRTLGKEATQEQIELFWRVYELTAKLTRKKISYKVA